MDVVSVVVVCYNEVQERIRYTLDSIVAQDYPELELVVIDGGSEVRTIDALKVYKNKISTFLSEQDDGLYDAMNKGIRLSTGKWIIFMNIGDRFYSPEVLTKLMGNIHAGCGDLIYGDVFIGNKYLPALGRLSRYRLYDRIICHQALLSRRAVFESIGGFDISYSLIADRDWILRAVTKGHKPKHFAIPICDWEVGGKCSDYKAVDKELIRYRSIHFSRFERLMYVIFRGSSKTLERIRSFNFALPVGLKRYFWRTEKRKGKL
jgi:glycosyltransferase involved in cell wall biosynthesis